jgi:hypothetical protein
MERSPLGGQRRWPLGPYGLGIVFLVLWLANWAGYAVTEYAVNERYPPHEVPWLLEFANGTLENTQSEMLQVLSMIVFTAFFVFRDSAESRDSDDRMQAQVDRIEQRLEDVRR